MILTLTYRLGTKVQPNSLNKGHLREDLLMYSMFHLSGKHFYTLYPPHFQLAIMVEGLD